MKGLISGQAQALWKVSQILVSNVINTQYVVWRPVLQLEQDLYER